MESWMIEGGKCWRGQDFDNEVLGLDDGLISETNPKAARRFDAKDLLVMPGLIDLHGDAFERQWMPRANVIMPFDVALPENDRQLIANGITTPFYGVTLGFEPGLRSADQAASIIKNIKNLQKHLTADSQIHLRFENRVTDHVSLVEAMIETKSIAVLAFNDHVADQMKEMKKPGKRETYFARSGLAQTDYEQMLQGLADQTNGEIDARIGDLADKALAQGIATMMHDPCGDSDVKRFAALGCHIAEFPMDIEAAQTAKSRSMPVVMGSPNVVRGGSHKGLVGAADLVGRGLCDVLTSDYYYPSMLAAIIKLKQKGIMDIGHAWNLMSKNAADAIGMDDRGTLEVGKRGDLVLLQDGDIPVIIAVFVGGKLAFLRDPQRI